MRIDQAKDRGRSEVLGDLIARKKWRPAIELLREQILSGAAPSIDGRLQLVDLMLLAGRGREAVPVLLGLADEFASNGYVAKSVSHRWRTIRSGLRQARALRDGGRRS
jgi:hypothetical protein